MKTLEKVEETYPGLGSCMLDVFLPGKLRPEERQKWDELERTARGRNNARKECDSA